MSWRQFASRNSGWLTAVVFANSLLALGLMLPRKQDGEWRLFSALNGQTRAQDDGTAAGGDVGPIVNVGNVNVMLHANDRDHFVEANFALEMASEDDRAVVGQRLSRIREASIGFLSGMRPEELRGSQGMQKAKSLMLERVRKAMPRQRIKAVYVTSLVVD